ncbi:hypothetical protein NKJ06_33370 [Mesorhizobium sp. M0293]|uniref:hypothetical protein n=1 Tax=Mesorhizobium sp. M0293 TaxID=2956930 RepID=UPI003338128C
MAELIIPKYVSERVNSTIELGSSTVEITQSGKTVAGNGQARLYLGQRELVIVTVNFPTSTDSILLFDAKGKTTLRFGSLGRPVDVICLESRPTSSSCEMQFLARSGPFVFCCDRRIRLQSVVLHLLNFPAFVCLGDIRTISISHWMV